MASEPKTGSLLRTLAASKPNGRFLELGTGTGMATAWILAGMNAESTLQSIDNDTEVQGVAKEILGRDRRLTLTISDGLKFIQEQRGQIYDFIFADAMPGKYNGLDECLRLVKPGGFYVIDDMLPQTNWPEGHAERVPVLIAQLARHKEFALTPLGWASGLVVAVRLRG